MMHHTREEISKAEKAAADQRKKLAHLICPTCLFPKAMHQDKPCPKEKA